MSNANNRSQSLRRVLSIKVSPGISHGGNLGARILWSHAQTHDSCQLAKFREKILGNKKMSPLSITSMRMATTGISFAEKSVLSFTLLEKERSESENGFFDIFL